VAQGAAALASTRKPRRPLGWGQSLLAQIDGLTYDQANELLAAFNNGTTSFDGRVW
jgi:hypothetical protein